MKPLKIAALLTCHNRKDKTLLCLDALNAQVSEGKFDIKVYVVDSGSTDGTAEAIVKRYPEVNLISCNDDIYWCGGMRIAFEHAMGVGYNYYLWLNDDTLLVPNAVLRMLGDSELLKNTTNNSVIIVGSVQDPLTGDYAYGGLRYKNGWHPLLFERVLPVNYPLKCATMNGNCVLIPDNIAKNIGFESINYSHGLGDYDYGLTATKRGYSCWITSGYVGSCKKNFGLLALKGLSFKDNLKELSKPTGLPPAEEWRRFTRRHAGFLWPLYWMRVSIRSLFPWLWVLLRNKG